MTIVEAARHLEVDRTTVQGWIRRGCPCVRPGAVGRGRGALLDLAAVRVWRSGEAGAGFDVAQLASAMAVAFRRPSEGARFEIWRELGLSRRQAAALYLELFAEITRELTGVPIERDDLPAQMRTIFRILVDSRPA